MGYPATDSQLVQELRVKATAAENRLSSTNDSTFDKLYMSTQVDMHRLALDTIDTRLTPAASGEDLKQLITTMRPRVADHLQMAQTILHTLP
jgi:predicted outer membrane protein